MSCPVPNPLFWKIDEAPVFLLGSIHLGPEGGYILPEGLLRDWDRSELIHFEVNPFAPLPDLAHRKSGTLTDEIGPDRAAGLRRLLGNPADFDTLTVFGATGRCALAQYLLLGVKWGHGLDHQLYRRAESQGKAIGTLETVEAQVEALTAGSIEEMIAGLDLLLQTPQLMAQVANNTLYSFVHGDLRPVAEIRKIMRILAPSRSVALLDRREAAWMPKIIAAIAARVPTVFVFGLMHLAEDDGVLGRLAAGGCTAERQSYPAPSVS